MYSSTSNPVLKSDFSSNSSWISLISCALSMIASLPSRTLSEPSRTSGRYAVVVPSGSSIRTVPSSAISTTLNLRKLLSKFSFSFIYSRPTSKFSSLPLLFINVTVGVTGVTGTTATGVAVCDSCVGCCPGVAGCGAGCCCAATGGAGVSSFSSSSSVTSFAEVA